MSEGIPLTVIEAMATSVPVISTNVGSVADVVSHGSSGFLALARDEIALATHLTTLGNTPLLRDGDGRPRPELRAVAEFSESVMADSYAALFDAAIACNRCVASAS